ncbi:MAG: sulfurtransferase [Rhodospirillaceae bacterium]|nr:sulfurtransferase [Rhodospirillaceae bacterium]MBT5664720.1 sulfurtransferase [Rhodospirillaceae bacterium]MBT5810564.1 sulfurtransferase [Rhodospirillaceae bacterium]
MNADAANDVANPDLLWSVETLAARLDDPKLRIIDVRPGERFAMGHIVGARHFDIYALNCDDTDDAPLNSFIRMWAFLLGRRGVSIDDTIVFCGEITGMTAARGFWFAEYLGHDDVHVLDGGYTAWAAAGRPTTRDAELQGAVPFRFEPRRDRLATYTDMLGAIDASDSIIIDTRSRAEFLGTDVRSARGGAVPGAVHIEWLNHLNDDGTLKSPDALRALFESHGVTPDKDILPYCQTGYRSAHAYLALRLLGYPKARNYLGSWNEWGNREGMPIETPAPETPAPQTPGGVEGASL